MNPDFFFFFGIFSTIGCILFRQYIMTISVKEHFKQHRQYSKQNLHHHQALPTHTVNIYKYI